MKGYAVQMKATAKGRVVENKLGVCGATVKQLGGGRRYEGAVNACWTDDQPRNVPPWDPRRVNTRAQETMSFPSVNSTCSIRIQARVPDA